MNRRRFVGTTAAVGLASLAGCFGQASASVDPPTVSEERLSAGGWERIDAETFTESFAGTTASGHTLQFEDAKLREAITEQTLGAVGRELSVFFATRIEFSPPLDNLPLGVGRDSVLSETESYAREDFRSRLEERGLIDIEVVEETTLTVDSGAEADLVEYCATLPLDDFSFDVAGGETVTLPAEPLDVTGLLAVWYDDGPESTLVAGSVFARENYADTVEVELSSAIDATIDIDLGLAPDMYRAETLGLVQSVR
ncbi:hypothetical protein [Halorarius litoreus]|uniref:hypothetical protein n=1 Tax=Halorarius litoreus TaxID=2962676 RepID=UPI0020CBA29F|nr:hypothetical protein [Halorarius litoreus]